MFRSRRVSGAFITTLRKWMILVASVAAVASFIAEYGFYLSAAQDQFVVILDIVIVALFLLETALGLMFSLKPREAFVRALPLLVIASLFGLQLLIVRYAVSGHPGTTEAVLHFFKLQSLTKIYVILLQGYIAFTVVFYTQRISRRLAHIPFRPAQMLLAAFVLLIAAGTLMLMLPKATPELSPLSWVDALFTSTSAVCVTGLIVVDTATDFTRTGQFIILFLMQIGGLGIMTFAAFFTLAAGKGFGIRERVVFGEVMQVDLRRDLSDLVVSIMIITALFEAAGALLFSLMLPSQPGGALATVFTALFHSVSGFCNAGFSTFSDSFLSFAGNYGLNIVLICLIVLGGLGFTVHLDLYRNIAARFRRHGPPVKMRLQTRVVLTATLLLIVLGGAGVFLLESGRLTPLQAVFQSVTARTAGFNSVDEGTLSAPSQLVTMFLMFIGAAPGSTGGGIKVTTLVVFLATVAAMLRGRPRTELLRKTIPDDTVREAVVIFGLSLFAVVVGFMILLITESAPFKVLLFEVVSAFGTVGLSLGVTPALSFSGKIVITVIMLFGRIGPMTLALAVSGRLLDRGYAYPNERIMVG